MVYDCRNVFAYDADRMLTQEHLTVVPPSLRIVKQFSLLRRACCVPSVRLAGGWHGRHHRVNPRCPVSSTSLVLTPSSLALCVFQWLKFLPAPRLSTNQCRMCNRSLLSSCTCISSSGSMYHSLDAGMKKRSCFVSGCKLHQLLHLVRSVLLRSLHNLMSSSWLLTFESASK